MRSIQKYFLGIILIMMFVFNFANLYAEGDGISKAKETVSMLETGFNFLSGTVVKLVGGSSIFHGVVGGLISGISTYS
ncbi:MAG: hypothetical protein PHU47_01760, partial [Candidatus ainarchaeum sp.]|nr:hypothetical protein [Candidatus ainarchaeum sp.]